MSMKPTIYTLAKQAGVSIATVSRAFNSSTRIRDTTRARILEIASEIGYQPSASARNLSLQKTETLALVFPQISGPYFSEFIRGAESVTRLHNYHLLVYSSPDANEEDPLLRLLPSRTDGIILGTHYCSYTYIHQLYQQGFPFLVLGRIVPGLMTRCLRPDNETGAYLLTRHLIDLHAYQKIAFISGPEASGFSAARQLLDLTDRPQAIFAANDQMAIGAIAAANERGCRVPEDLAVVGFDDIPTARYLQPALTTVNLAIFDQGVQSVELLLEQIVEPDLPAKVITTPTTLMIRRSCGCGEV
jgi:LacI family transcriptional regulator